MRPKGTNDKMSEHVNRARYVVNRRIPHVNSSMYRTETTIAGWSVCSTPGLTSRVTHRMTGIPL